MALYGSGMAYGHSHGNASLPIVLAGGTQLGLKHGQHVDFNLIEDFKGYDKHPGIYHNPVNIKAHLSNLLLTMAQKMDVKTEKFADSNGTRLGGAGVRRHSPAIRLHRRTGCCATVRLRLRPGEEGAASPSARPPRMRGETAKVLSADTGKYFSGELVIVDAVNRRGALRLDGDGPLHYFAMLPYGMIGYNGAPAELRDLPLGTHLHGSFTCRRR